ncbi:MAG: serine hydrolase, partial [Clostridiales bacterium]|nr:serine hydrolase [Clostridiales bacterium]
YTYTVRCTDASGTSHTSGYDKTGKTIRYLCAPVLSGVSNTVSGVKITWKAVTGAEKYRVYRKASGDSSWTRVKTTSSVSYTDTSVKSGTTYTYTVRCVNSTGTAFTSSFDSTGKTILYLSAPVLTSVTNTTSGIKIKWSSVTGAVNYRVFRKTSASSTWKGIANTTSTSYTDTSAKSGTTYLYTVRCINSDGTSYTSSYDSSGLSIRYLSAPVLSSVSNTTSGVSITWKAVTGAEKYRVYRKASGASSWTRVKTTSSTSCTDTSVKTGTTYTYTVRCVNSAGTAFTSSFDSTGKSILYVAAPALSSISGSSTGSITVKWTTVSAVTGYQIRYSTSSGFSSYSTVTLSGASSSSKTISGLTAGSIYYVRIRSYITVSGKNYYSGWSATKTSDPEEALSGLKTTISSMTQSYGGTWSVYIKNLETGDILNLNEQSMYPASVIKAFVMASVYNEINEGRLTETSTISSLLNSMITISDNESYNELVRVQSSSGSSFLSGAAVVNAYLSANGYTNTCVHHTLHPAYSSLVSDGGSNISSAKDCGVLLERIYNGTCVSKTYSQKMLNLLLAQQRRTKIPAGVPSGIQVANKTGETSTTENDIAIVFGEKTDYVICVFSSGSSYGATGIKNISKTVYEYLN